MTATNTGNVTLTSVGVQSDTLTQVDTTAPENALSSFVAGGSTTIAPGASVDFTATYIVGQADIDAGGLSNTATVVGTTPNAVDVTDVTDDDDAQDGNLIDDPTVTTLGVVPSLALVKTATLNDDDGTAGVSAGDTIEYAFTVTNTGNVTLTVTDIADAKINVLGGPVTLQPGDVDRTSFSGDYTITLADIVAGEVANTATVNAFVDDDANGTKDAGETDVTDISGTAATNDDPTVTQLLAIVDIALVKSENFQDMTGNGSSNDDIITYSFEVTNMGNVELTDVIVTDDDIQWSDGNTEIGRVASLMPGQSQAFSKTYQITDADINAGSIVNQAVASATAPGTLNDPSDLSGPTVDSNEVIKTFLGSIAGHSINKNGSVASGVTAILYKMVNGSLVEVSRSITDAQGAYAFNELEQAEYAVEFVSEGSFVYGQGDEAQDTNGVAKEVDARKNMVESISLVAGSMTAQDVDAILIDPSGVVYDSRTFLALGGAEVYLERVVGSGKEIVPSAQINGSENPVITGADGVYSFFFSNPAPTGTYTLRVVKAGYDTVDGSTSSYSTIIPVSTSTNGVSGLAMIEDGRVSVETGAGVIEITADVIQPANKDQAQYFGAFDMTFTDWTDDSQLSKGILHNHIPLDMTAPSMGMKVTKTADISALSSIPAIGETINYTITAENTGSDTYVNLRFDDPLTEDANEVFVTTDNTFDPGDIWTWTTEYALTAADIAAGTVENTATITGTTPIGDVEIYESSDAGNTVKGAGNGSPTVVALATLLEQIEDDLKIVLANDLAITMRQHSGVMRGYATGALARLKSSPNEGSCAATVNAAINGRTIEFDTASAVILAKNGPLLDDIAKAAMSCKDEVLSIGGHTDDRASEAYNQDLSESRAKSVRAALAQRGVPVETLNATGYGESSPIAPNTTDKGRQANRRVEFTSETSDASAGSCVNGTQANRTASANATDSSVSGNGSFKRETTNCEDRAWAVTDGTASYLKTDQGMAQWMFDLSHRRERMVGQDAVRGWFVGAYGAKNDVSGLAEGSITGYGLSGGVYGANRIEQSLFLDYYLGVAAGQHDFDLDFKRATVITATGDYKYLAYFAGVALSGKKELEAVTLSPRFGVDLSYTGGADINVKAQDAFRSEIGSMRLDAMSGARVFAELGLMHKFASDSSRDMVLSVTPQTFCDRPIGTTDTVCGYGGRVDLSQNNHDTKVTTKFFVNYEGSKGSQAASFGMSAEKKILDDMGSLSSTLSASNASNAVLNLSMDLKF